MNFRAGPHQGEHDVSLRRGRDWIADKPQSLRTLFRWLTRGYALEVPTKLHSGAVLEEDGDPAMTGEAKAWLGMTDDKEANDWLRIACRTDGDGFFRTPMRCAIARVKPEGRRNLLADLSTRLYLAGDIAEANDIPAWAAADVIGASLSILWDVYSDRPLPRASVGWASKSQAQRDAEDAA